MRCLDDVGQNDNLRLTQGIGKETPHFTLLLELEITELVGYLIGKGADVNAVNLYGDSPLERASANHRMDVVQVLSEHGGKDIKGDAEQRDRASKEIVHRDIEEMNSGRR